MSKMSYFSILTIYYDFNVTFIDKANVRCVRKLLIIAMRNTDYSENPLH